MHYTYERRNLANHQPSGSSGIDQPRSLAEERGAADRGAAEAVAHRVERVVEGGTVATVERQRELDRVGIAEVRHRDADQREPAFLDERLRVVEQPPRRVAQRCGVGGRASAACTSGLRA